MVLLGNSTLSDTLTLDDLEISPRSQGTAGASQHHHSPRPLTFLPPQISVFSSYWSYRPF